MLGLISYPNPVIQPHDISIAMYIVVEDRIRGMGFH